MRPAILLVGVLLIGCGCISLSESADEWNSRGETHHTMGRYEEAVTAFDRAIAIDPDHEGAWKNRGLSLAMLNRTSESEESFVRAIAFDPTDAKVFYSQALARNATGDRAGALASIERGIAIAPTSRNDAITLFSSLQFQGDLLTLEGRHEEANRSYARAHEVMQRTI